MKPYIIHLNVTAEDFDKIRDEMANEATGILDRKNSPRYIQLLLARRSIKTQKPHALKISSSEATYYANDKERIQKEISNNQLFPRSRQLVIHRGYSKNTLSLLVRSISLLNDTFKISYETRHVRNSNLLDANGTQIFDGDKLFSDDNYIGKVSVDPIHSVCVVNTHAIPASVYDLTKVVVNNIR